MSDLSSDALFKTAIQYLSNGNNQQAFEIFKQAAMQHHVKAQLFYAWFCLNNSTIRNDKSEDELSALDLEGVQTIEKNLDSEEAMHLLCQFYEHAAKDSPEQLFEISGHAKLGFPHFYISRLYHQLNMPEKADHYLQEAALNFEHPVAQNLYGFALFNKSEIEEGIKYIRLAAKQDFATAHFNLGVFAESKQYADDKYNTGEYAMQCYQQAAQLGYVEAMYVIGWLSYYGQGCEENIEIAANWYYQAALKGHVKGMNNYAYLLENDEVEPFDEKSCYDYYLAAAKANYEVAQFNLALYLKKNNHLDEALQWFEKVGEGESGRLEAQLQAARIYLERANFPKAEYWLKKTIRQKHVDSMINLAILHENGDIDGEPNYGEAARLYLMAVDYHHPEGEYGAALLYLSGQGVPKKSREIAIELLELAVKHDHPDAIDLLEKLRLEEALLQTPKPAQRPRIVVQSTPNHQLSRRTPRKSIRRGSYTPRVRKFSSSPQTPSGRRNSLMPHRTSPIHSARQRFGSLQLNAKPAHSEKQLLLEAIENVKKFKNNWIKLKTTIIKSQRKSYNTFEEYMNRTREEIATFMSDAEPEKEYFNLRSPDFTRSDNANNENIFAYLRSAYHELYGLLKLLEKNIYACNALDDLIMSFGSESEALLKQLDVFDVTDFEKFIREDCQSIYRLYSKVIRGLSSTESLLALQTSFSHFEYTPLFSELLFPNNYTPDQQLEYYEKIKEAMLTLYQEFKKTEAINFDAMTNRIDQSTSCFIEAANKLLAIEKSNSNQKEDSVSLSLT